MEFARTLLLPHEGRKSIPDKGKTTHREELSLIREAVDSYEENAEGQPLHRKRSPSPYTGEARAAEVRS